MEHDIALLTPTLVACVSASSGQKSPDTTRHALDQGPHPSWPICSPRLADNIVWFIYGASAVIHVSDSDWHLIPNMLNWVNWVHVWTPSWPVHDLNILLVPKGCRVTCCMGWGIVLDVHKVTSKHPIAHGNISFLRIWMYRCCVHGSIHHDQLTPLPMVDCTPYQDWRATIAIIRLEAGINQPLPLPTSHPDLTVTVVLREPGLITEDKLSPLSEVRHCLLPQSRRRRLCS